MVRSAFLPLLAEFFPESPEDAIASHVAVSLGLSQTTLFDLFAGARS
ncbi:MAG TPA: hypothetical protein V6C91_16850 [Coleofasciculaceae cyanobacterium]